MSGNVWEFVAAPYGEYPIDPQYNPVATGDWRLRGGGGGASAADCRVSRRYWNWYGSWDFGIRLVIRP
jgi:formylglycine-generating enzyme required for sulfatase activity